MDGEFEPPSPADPVAGWVAQGLRDAEIAVRLGVSVGEARARRSRLHDRPAAPSSLALAPPPPLPLSAPPRGVEEQTAAGNRAAILAPAIIAAVLAAAGGWWLLSAGSEPAPTRSVAGFAPELLSTESATMLRQGPSIEFPDDLSLVVRTPDGSGAATALKRYYRPQGGDLQVEDILVAPAGSTIGRVVSDVDGWLLVAPIHSEASTAFLRSTDGGVSWEEQGSLEGQWEPVGVWEGETIAWRDRAGGLGEFVRVPSGDAFVPPYPGGGLPLAILAKGRLLWRVPGSGAIAEGDGAVSASPEVGQGSYHEWLAPQPTGAATMIHWTGTSPATGEKESYVGIMTRRGAITQSWVGLPGPIAGRRDGATVVALAPHPEGGGQSMAVLVELQANSWRPIVVGLDLLTSNDEHFIAAVRAGPFVRAEGSGDCVPIHAASGKQFEVISCVADGVILRAPGEARVHVDYTWRPVLSPSGRPGWVDVADLR